MRTTVAVGALFVGGLAALVFGVLLFAELGRGSNPQSAATALIAVAILASAFLCTAAVLWARGDSGPSPRP